MQAAIIMCFVVLLGRCAWIALVHGPNYAVRAVQQRSVDVVVARARGQIFDRDMRLLAGTPNELASPWPHRAVVVVFPSLVSGQDEALRRLDELIPGPGVCAGSPRVTTRRRPTPKSRRWPALCAGLFLYRFHHATRGWRRM